ncbi:MAG TPA: carbonate dehydratase [Bacteroidetes bacterium]|nr:carbonate dehydratase [Bacteroidota bacterium]
MKDLAHLFRNNRAWTANILAKDPFFFDRLSRQQSPKYLWIGCSDSRVPANEIVGLLPGELFVHRNVANIVVQTDLNCLSVIQYAVEVLHVEHIIVTGHYGCGGVQAAFHGLRLGLIDDWLRHVEDIMRKHAAALSMIPDETKALNRLCELNVIQQAVNVGETTIVRQAWERGEVLTVHGWIYDLNDGLLRDLEISASSREELSSTYMRALTASR